MLSKQFENTYVLQHPIATYNITKADTNCLTAKMKLKQTKVFLRKNILKFNLKCADNYCIRVAKYLLEGHT